jgi:surfeit locus 1 family protein
VSIARAARRRSILLAALFTLIGLGVLVGLGLWQLERKAWKEALIARLEERLAHTPMPLPAPNSWERLGPDEAEFRHVRFDADVRYDQQALVFAAGSALRPDVSGPGYWVFAPAKLPDGSVVVVNRGFLPQGREDAKISAAGAPPGRTDIIGVLRWPEPRGLFTPADDPAHNRWFVRDPAAIAAAKGWGRVAPFYVEQEAPVPPGGWPQPGPLQVNLPNNHLQYAITWFGLAAALIVVFALWAPRRFSESPSG